MKRVILFAVVAVALMCLPSTALAAKAGTRVTLDNIQRTATEFIYTGDIFSSRRACKNNRRVFVYRARAGADELLGSTRSYKGSAQPGYYWTVEDEAFPIAGNYYSKVRPTTRCKRDSSAILRVGN